MDYIKILTSGNAKKVDSIDVYGVNFGVYESETFFYCIYEFNGFADRVMSLSRPNVNDLEQAKKIFELSVIYIAEYNEDYMHFNWLNMLGGYIIKKCTFDRFCGRFHCIDYLREYNQFELVEGEELESVVDRLPDGALDSFHDPKVYRCFNGKEWHHMVMNGYTWMHI